MANTENEKNSVTGLDLTDDRKSAEYDLVTSLLEAASYKTAEESITEVSIERNKKFLFAVRIHPISDSDVKFAQKKAGIYKPNPTNKKLGMVKVDTENDTLASWLIYKATVEEDQEKIWGNPAIMSKFSLRQPWESIDFLLLKGEKDKLLETVFKISGMDDDEDGEGQRMDDEEFAKN